MADDTQNPPNGLSPSTKESYPNLGLQEMWMRKSASASFISRPKALAPPTNPSLTRSKSEPIKRVSQTLHQMITEGVEMNTDEIFTQLLMRRTTLDQP